MKLEHINIVVRDMKQTLHFYQAAFPHWRVRGQGKAPWYGKPRNWLHFGDDQQYITFNDHGVGENRDLTSLTVGLCHFAYQTSNITAVIERLKQAGYNIAKPGAETPYRQNVYFIDPNGFEIEFVQYNSDLPEERNMYDE